MDNPDYHHLANGPSVDDEGNVFEDGRKGWVEAPFLYRHGEVYYLFVNWYACCNRLESTYEIRVGRSASPTGPFLDKDGVDMRDGGGSLFLDRGGSILGDPKMIGHGHAGIYEQTDGVLCLSSHYYDGSDEGIPKLGLAGIAFIDGWPKVVAAGCTL